MALVFEEKKEFNWKGLIVFGGAIILAAATVYFLFFTPVPAIEVILPPAVKSTAEISTVALRPNLDSVMKELPPQGKLRRYVSQQSIGQIGRPNPFVKF